MNQSLHKRKKTERVTNEPILHVHGGNIYQSENCLDFSANLNPLGIPESVQQAIVDSFVHLAHYPQVGYEPLRKAIAEYEQCSCSQVICGNGAAELIYTLCHARKPKKALIPAPTFAEYELALQSTGCEIEYYALDEAKNFVIDEGICEQIHQDTDMIFICNPNNPTGILTQREVLLKIAEKCQSVQALLVVDECFLDFVRDEKSFSLKEYLNEWQNVFLLKAFTKRYAMAGIRLGYGLSSNHELLQRMNQAVQPWNVSVMAQYAGIAALKEREYVEKAREIVLTELDYLKKQLTKLGLHVFPSESNYIFFQGPSGLAELCKKEKIMLRDCSNYTGLHEGWYRVAVRLHEENEKLVEVLGKIL